MTTVQVRSRGEDAVALARALGIGPLRIRLPDDWVLTNDKLLELCSLNDTVPFEVDETGALILNMPSGPTSEWIGMEFVFALRAWMDVDAGDRVFGSGAMFELPDGNRRAPDAAWISAARLTAVDLFDGKVWSVSPDFVVEVLSLSDDLDRQQAKMALWLRNGVRLGWLVDPFEQRLWVCRPGTEAVMLERPSEMSDAEVLPGLVVDLRRVWRSE